MNETERQRETERTVDNDKKKQASSIWQVVSSTKKTDSCQIEKKSAVINGLIVCITVVLVTNRHQQKQLY